MLGGRISHPFLCLIHDKRGTEERWFEGEEETHPAYTMNVQYATKKLEN